MTNKQKLEVLHFHADVKAWGQLKLTMWDEIEERDMVVGKLDNVQGTFRFVDHDTGRTYDVLIALDHDDDYNPIFESTVTSVDSGYSDDASRTFTEHTAEAELRKREELAGARVTWEHPVPHHALTVTEAAP